MKVLPAQSPLQTVILSTLFFIALGILWTIREILIIIFVCFVIMEALNPIIVKLENFKIKRPFAIILVYILVISLLSFIIAGIIPVLINQTSELISIFPQTIANINLFGLSALDLSNQFKIIETIPAQVAQVLVGFVSNTFSGFVILVITYYFLIERQYLEKHAQNIFKDVKLQKLMISIFEKLERRLGGWVVGEIILMSIIGIMSYVGYLVLGLPYALPLAIIAGLLEIVPNIGPIITSVIAVLVGLTVSPFVALLTIILGIVLHESENDFITPKIMQETVGMNPVITILAIATGAKLAGIGGALMAVPIYLTLETIITTIWKNKN